MEKRVAYTHSNSYSTLNQPSEQVVNLWMAFHGMGHLSRYFIRHFKGLPPETNFVIAPQAPSKYYQGSDFKHVGASWLTREDTANETQNVLSYVQAVWAAEESCPHKRKIVLGYSQGVSIATRWLAHYKQQCDLLVLHSGGLPKELDAKHFDHLSQDCQVQSWYGTDDPYLNPQRMTSELDRASTLFGNRLKVVEFDGGHVVNEALIKGLTS